jgi:hypothetical protein
MIYKISIIGKLATHNETKSYAIEARSADSAKKEAQKLFKKEYRGVKITDVRVG